MTDFTFKCLKCKDGIIVIHNMGDSVNFYCPECGFSWNTFTQEEFDDFIKKLNN